MKLEQLLDELKKGPCGKIPLGQGVQDGKGPHGLGNRRKQVSAKDKRFGIKGRLLKNQPDMDEWIEESADADQEAYTIFKKLAQLNFYGSSATVGKIVGGMETLEHGASNRMEADKVYQSALQVLTRSSLDLAKNNRGIQGFISPDTGLLAELYMPRDEDGTWYTRIAFTTPEARMYQMKARKYGA